jgi:arylsulfatase A-like enzyme
MKRREFFSSAARFLAGSLLLPEALYAETLPFSSSVSALPPFPPARKPNIIVILADDLGYGSIGAQGCRDIPTPQIDQMARDGVRCTSGYVTCPVCSPTRAGLMTGRYQQRFGHETNPGPESSAESDFGLPRSETILPERMKALGYATGMVGKWHLGYQPELQPSRRGFDSFYGFLGGANPYLPTGRRGLRMLRGTEPVNETEYLTEAFTREAVGFMEQHRQQPFFLYLAFNAVHNPLQASQKYLSRFSDIKEEKRRVYAAMLSALDDAVGTVMAKLREWKLEEDTLVFFLSDNGGPTPQTTSSNSPLRGYKGQMWEGGIRVPFIVQWKKRLPAGKVYTRPVSSLDILPTAVAAAGGRLTADWKLDGVDLLPHLSSRKSGEPHKTLYWRMGERSAIRDGDWKLVTERGGAAPALFNLSNDIGEKSNLAERMPETVRELSAKWERWASEMKTPTWRRQGGRPRARQNRRRQPQTAPPMAE